MEKVIRVSAPAKLNLHLRVMGRREDGFHDLQSLFQAVSLADEIVVRSLKESDRIEIEGRFDCAPEATTVYKAAQAFREAAGIRTGLCISVDKRIPAGAGLGGGSSDAASVLLALDALFETRLDDRLLSGLGARIGSDVPFFLTGGLALVGGRGERVEALSGRNDLAMLLVYPAAAVSTPWAFKLLDRARPSPDAEPAIPEHELRKLYFEPPARWPFFNSFQPYVAREVSNVARCLGLLEASGAEFTLMSGSGSSVFGVFPDPEGAAAAGQALADRLPRDAQTFIVSSLARRRSLD